MAGIFGKAPITSDIALLMEVIVVILLFFGRYRFARGTRIRKHGYMMSLATGIHLISVLLIMIPSLIRSLDFVIVEFLSPIIMITVVHVPAGSLTLVLSLYLLINWGVGRSERTCYKKLKTMRSLWWLWLFSIALGIIMYLAIALFS